MPAEAVLCDAENLPACWDINNNIFIPLHLAKREVQARPARETSNTTGLIWNEYYFSETEHTEGN